MLLLLSSTEYRINCGEDISAETDECRHFSVVDIDVETQRTVKVWRSTLARN